MNGAFATMDAWMTAALFALTLLATYAIGWWYGRRAHRRGKQLGTAKAEDASLALLGLLLAFTFSMALAKHEQRRMMVITDANSIGDFYTCVCLLKDPPREALQNQVRQYTELRLNLAKELRRTPNQVNAELENMQRMQTLMTQMVSMALNQGTPIAVPLTNTLNELTSSHASRLAALEDRLPGIIVMLLFVSGAVSIGLLGSHQGHDEQRPLLGMLGLILMLSLVVMVIMDLNQPARGFIQVSQEPIERLLGSMAATPGNSKHE